MRSLRSLTRRSWECGTYAVPCKTESLEVKGLWPAKPKVEAVKS